MEYQQSGLKRCSKCGKEKESNEYWTGGQQQCKDCCNEQRKRKRKKDIVYAEIVRVRNRNNWDTNKEKYNSRRRMLCQTDESFRKNGWNHNLKLIINIMRNERERCEKDLRKKNMRIGLNGERNILRKKENIIVLREGNLDI